MNIRKGLIWSTFFLLLVIALVAPTTKSYGQLVAQENLLSKRSSELVNYTKERDMGAYIDGLWDRIGKGFSKSGVQDKDIDKAIRQVRSKND